MQLSQVDNANQNSPYWLGMMEMDKSNVQSSQTVLKIIAISLLLLCCICFWFQVHTPPLTISTNEDFPTVHNLILNFDFLVNMILICGSRIKDFGS